MRRAEAGRRFRTAASRVFAKNTSGKNSAAGDDPINLPAGVSIFGISYCRLFTFRHLPSLENLLKLLRRGLEQPIHFFPESSFEYAEQLLKKGVPESSALSKAAKKWTGSDFAKYVRGESADLFYDLCFRRMDLLDESFQEIAGQVFSPMFLHSRGIKV